MIAQLIWIAVVYASAAVIIHMVHNRQHVRRTPQSGKRIHYIFITRNDESVVEGYIRALAFQALLTGKRLQATFMDDDSNDGTLRIVSKMAASGCSIDLATSMYSLRASDELQNEGIVVDLRLSSKKDDSVVSFWESRK